MRQLRIANQFTNRDSMAFDKYLSDINSLDMISAEKEIELSAKIKEGDENAINELVSANLRFVVSVAKQYQNQGLAIQDLVNEGNLGLIKAAQKFDASKGFKFISYAVWWIRQSILQALANNGRIVRLPLNKMGMLNKIKSVSNFLEQKYEREPTFEEISLESNIDVENIDKLFNAKQKALSMDVPLGSDDDNLTLYDTLGYDRLSLTEAKLLNDFSKWEISEYLKTLKEKEIFIVKSYYGLDGYSPITHGEIANKLGISGEQVRRINKAVIKKLKKIALKERKTTL
jgi:RNA polymerase primary sigma factor